MIRLPPTAIVLGRADLRDFDKRRKYAAVEARFPHEAGEQRVSLLQNIPIRIRDQSHYGSVAQLAEEEVHSRSQEPHEIPDPKSNQSPRKMEHEADPSDDDEDEHDDLWPQGNLGKASENATSLFHQPSSPDKHIFYYGGFVETPGVAQLNNSLNSSPYALTTPLSHNASLSEIRRASSRHPLPRSPLFISHNISTSPERLTTTSLTPRVTSRVANHNTPGIIFSQPARRPRRSAPGFRHQTNSFSFDSSERASAAYEQERVTSYSTTESRLWPTAELNLREELGGSSLSGSSSASESRSSPDSLVHSLEGDLPTLDDINNSAFSERTYTFSSPKLPPPFSTALRSSSRIDTLPTLASDLAQHPGTSPVYSSPTGPEHGSYEGVSRNPIVTNDIFSNNPDQSINGSSPMTFFQRAAQVISAYRSRTPSNNASPDRLSLPSSSAEQRGTSRVSSGQRESRTASANYRVYDDSLPRHTQPQTPAQLPEARHQSRFHPSLTAPAARAVSRINPDARLHHYPQPTRRQLSFATPSRRTSGRTNSPTGLHGRGFEGLYGGRENGDEEQNWTEGVRFNNAGVRLWALRDARNDGRSLRDTPEPEEWRVGRRE